MAALQSVALPVGVRIPYASQIGLTYFYAKRRKFPTAK